MPHISQSKLLPVLLQAANPLRYSVAIVLAWTMVADGNADKAEMELLKDITHPLPPDVVPMILDALKGEHMADVQLACEMLRDSLDYKEGMSFLELVIMMAVADGYLNFAESHIVYFVADLLGIANAEVHARYRAVTGRDMPPLADAGSKAWWDGVEDGGRGASQGKREGGRASATRNMDKARALAILGLDEDASREDIQAAYRRMAQVHHPDKFHCLGDEAVRAAEVSFARIQTAYEYLRA